LLCMNMGELLGGAWSKAVTWQLLLWPDGTA